MKSHAYGFALLSVIAIVASAPAQAQNGTLTRSFVSSTGVDTNACTITAPCASFVQAYTKVGANGIVAALDPGKYGPIAITGPVTINGNGWAAITGPSGGAAITINAASGNVTLAGLELDGAGASNEGIFLTSALSGIVALNIRDCVVSNFINSGIAIQPTGSGSTGVNIFIANTSSLSNGGDGIKINPESGNAFVQGTITGSNVANNSSNGFDVEGAGTAIAVVNSVASANGNDGIYNTGVLIIQNTTAVRSGGVDLNSGNGNAWIYHNTFGTISMTNTFVHSDGTNEVQSQPTTGLPGIENTY
jgi:hypothetical protein